MQTVLGAGGALLLLITPPRWLPRVAALDGAYAAGSLAAVLVATTVGLFGVMETTAATLWWKTFWIEVAAVLVLGLPVVLARKPGA